MTRFGLCLVAGLLLAGCNKAQPPTAAEKGAAERSRLKWNLANTVEAYKNAGHTSPQWDESAKAALTEFARARAGNLEPGEDADLIVSNNCAVAVEAACDDPLIRYLNLRFSMKGVPNAKVAAAYAKVAPDMESSAYPKMRKFYVWLMTHRQITYVYGYGTNVPQQFLELRAWDWAESDLMEALDDRTLPPEDASDACHELLEIWVGDKEHYASLYHACVDKFPHSWKNDASILLLKGEANLRFAWNGRGGGYANTVSNEGWRVFEDRLGVAEEALTRAWEIKPTEARIAYAMMRLELGQGKGRARMETWFNRAMQLNPLYYDACSLKLFYLEPKWYGSPKDMLEFGRECASNTNWGGHVPLILLDAHKELWDGLKDDSEKFNYWKRPEVWQDLKLAFDRFFEVNPQETGWYYSYAWYAWQAGAWDELNAAIAKLMSVNYDSSGSKEEFDAMVAAARIHAGGGKGRE